MRLCKECQTPRWPVQSDLWACPRCDRVDLMPNVVRFPAFPKPDTQLQRDCDEIIGPWIDEGRPFDWEVDGL